MKCSCFLLLLILHGIPNIQATKEDGDSSGNLAILLDSNKNTPHHTQSKEVADLRRFNSQRSLRSKRTATVRKASSHEEKRTEYPAQNVTFGASNEDINLVQRMPVGKRPANLFQKIKSLSFRKSEWKDLTYTGSTTPYGKCYDEKTPKRLKHEGCTPVRIWSLFRHGSRLPGGETIAGMRTRLKNLRLAILLKHWEQTKNSSTPDEEDELCYSKEVKEWKLRKELEEITKLSDEVLNTNKPPKRSSKPVKDKKGQDVVNTKSLTPGGKTTMKNIGKRFFTKFKDVIERAKKTKSFIFKFTDCERTRSSAEEIYRGAFGLDPKADNSWYVPVIKDEDGKDPLLKYDSSCKHWKKNYKKSVLDAYDLDSFKYGKEINEAVDSIRGKCGFSEKAFTFSDAKLLYETCAYEQIWDTEPVELDEKNNPENPAKNSDSKISLKKIDSGVSVAPEIEPKRNPWCDILTPENQEIFEYLEDFEFYKNDGPKSLSKKLGCIVFLDLVQRLIGNVYMNEKKQIKWEIDEKDHEKEGAETKLVTFYFTHLTAVLKFIAHIGIFDDPDEALRKDNFADMKERKWRSSRIGCFATNITFVLMNCGDRGYFILTLFQEKEIKLPGCPSLDNLCPLEDFLHHFEDSIFNCDYEEVCRADENPNYNQANKTLKWQSFSSDKSLKYGKPPRK